MSQFPSTPPGYDPIAEAIASHRRSKRSSALPWVVVALIALVLGATGIILADHLRPAAQIPAPAAVAPAPVVPSFEITHTTSVGGSSTRKGSAEGASLALSGDGVQAKDMALRPTVFDFGDAGSITGGGVFGSFSAKVDPKVLETIAIIGGFLFLGAAVWKYLKNRLDWWHYGSCAAAGIGCFMLAAGSVWGLAGIAAYVLCHMLPSFTPTGSEHSDGALATVQRTLGTMTKDIQTAFWEQFDKLSTHEQDAAVVKAAKKAGV